MTAPEFSHIVTLAEAGQGRTVLLKTRTNSDGRALGVWPSIAIVAFEWAAIGRIEENTP